MKKSIISLLCATGMVISGIAAADDLKVRPDAPQRYVVKQGDTLWGISGKYLHNPQQWNQLWDNNRNAMHNPHLIYPGQVLVLSYVDGKPQLVLEQENSEDDIPVIKLTPSVRETFSGYGIQTLSVNFYRIFMQHPQIISREQMVTAPRLIKGPDHRILYNIGDRVYADNVNEPGRYLVYRKTKDIIHPKTHKPLGQEVVFSGIVRTIAHTNSALNSRSKTHAYLLPKNEYYTEHLKPLVKLPTKVAQPMIVEEAVAEIRQGDLLLKLTDEQNSFQMTPHAPKHPVNASVISVFNGINSAGQFQTITLDKGKADGLDKGMIVSLYKRSKSMHVDAENSENIGNRVVKYMSIPAEEIGLAMVYRTSENLASAIILESLGNINIGDTAAEPGRDLDNMKDDSPYVLKKRLSSHN